MEKGFSSVVCSERQSTTPSRATIGTQIPLTPCALRNSELACSFTAWEDRTALGTSDLRKAQNESVYCQLTCGCKMRC
jgi:hypothetical protein